MLSGDTPWRRCHDREWIFTKDLSAIPLERPFMSVLKSESALQLFNSFRKLSIPMKAVISFEVVGLIG